MDPEKIIRTYPNRSQHCPTTWYGKVCLSASIQRLFIAVETVECYLLGDILKQTVYRIVCGNNKDPKGEH